MVEKKSEKPFIIIEIAGGLGNQMFQYAFFLKLQSLGYPCKLYYDKSREKHKGYELKKVFGIEAVFATEEELDEILDKDGALLSRLRRKIEGSRPSFYWEHDKGYAFKPEILKQDKPVYLQGCWLSEKYFDDISGLVKDAFKFKVLPENQEEEKNIKNKKHSVSIHIRRGDYLSSDIHRNLDYNEYVIKAARLMHEKVALSGSQPEFDYFVFSDDREYARQVLEEFSAENKVHFPVCGDAYLEMYLMTVCRHNIIANSTFSWWGAWLNENPDKMVIAPKDWFTTDFLNRNDIVPESWVTV